MRLNPKPLLAVLSAALLLCACKKSSQAPPTTPAETTPTADASGTPAAAPPAASAAPRNPALKVPPPGPPVVVNGVTVNVQDAEKALASASYELNVQLADVRYALRYTDFRTAFADLQKIATDPSLSEDQKGALGRVMEQVKQAAAANPTR